MSNDYAIGLLVEQHHAELRNEAAQNRLARLARLGRSRRPRWWERLMPSRSQDRARATATGRRTQPVAAPRVGQHRPTAAVAAGDSPC
jgi:hypothetical protein